MSDDLQLLYPDLVGVGLGGVLQVELQAIDGRLRVAWRETANRFATHARVEAGPRFSQISLAARERLFLFDCWCRGVCLGHGRTSALGQLVRAVARWVGSDCTIAGLAAGFAFFTPVPNAEAYERGEEVEFRWRDYLAGLGDRFPELVAFVRAAAGRRELRRLFPFTSHATFCFSRCTGYPFTNDTPLVVPLGGDRYEVRAPDGRVLGRGDAEEAADLVVRYLPAGCGRAVAGTAETIGLLDPTSGAALA